MVQASPDARGPHGRDLRRHAGAAGVPAPPLDSGGRGGALRNELCRDPELGGDLLLSPPRRARHHGPEAGPDDHAPPRASGPDLQRWPPAATRAPHRPGTDEALHDGSGRTGGERSPLNGGPTSRERRRPEVDLALPGRSPVTARALERTARPRPPQMSITSATAE